MQRDEGRQVDRQRGGQEEQGDRQRGQTDRLAKKSINLNLESETEMRDGAREQHENSKY